MAHIPDGVLSVPVLVGGGLATGAGLALAMRRLDETMIPRTAILASVFFAVSLVAVPVGPSSVHLLLSGLMGLVLGVLTIPAVFVGLILQSVMFGFGGLTTLGVNTFNIAFPGVLLGALFARVIARSGEHLAAVFAAVCGALAVVLTGAGVAFALALSSSEFVPSAKVLLVTYVPLMVAEALVTGFAIRFLKRVKPELLAGAEVE